MCIGFYYSRSHGDITKYNSCSVMNFSEYSSPLVEFKPEASTSKTVKITQGCQSDPVRTREVATSQKEKHATSSQCDLISEQSSVSITEIAKFLQRVSPIMIKELSTPCTPVNWNQSQGDEGNRSVSLIPDATMAFRPVENIKDRRIISTWISSKLIAVSFISQDHNLYCDHALESIYIIGEHSGKIPVRACVTALYSCPSAAKNILIAGTILGDIYIFKIVRQSGGQCTFVELHYEAGDGMVTTLNWFKSPNDNRAKLMISGQIDGRLNTWIYDKQNETVTPGHIYSIDKSGAPILIIETTSESSFCLHRRGSPPMIHDINNYTTNKEKNRAIVLARGQECKEIDALMEINQIKHIRSESEAQLIFISKHGDIHSTKFISGAAPENSVCIYRTPHIHINECFLIQKPLSLICLTTVGSLELFEITTGTRKTIPVASQLKHISLSPGDDRLLTISDDGYMEILSVIVSE